MRPAQILQMARLAESHYTSPTLSLVEGGLGGPEPSIDQHLGAAVKHAQHHLDASRKGDANGAQHHAQMANKHLVAAHHKHKAEQGAQRQGGGEGSKMVFGVWRKVGGQLSPDEHKALGAQYTQHAKRQKAKIDARVMLSGSHPNDLPPEAKGEHYKEVADSLKAAQSHFQGKDPLHGPSGAPAEPKPPAKPPEGHKPPGGGSPKPPGGARTAHPESANRFRAMMALAEGEQPPPPAGGGGGHKGQKMVFGVWRNAKGQPASTPEEHEAASTHHRNLAKAHGARSVALRDAGKEAAAQKHYDRARIHAHHAINHSIQATGAPPLPGANHGEDDRDDPSPNDDHDINPATGGRM